MEAEKKIKELREALNRHNHNYYVLNSPEISDKEFDMMMKELEALEADHPNSTILSRLRVVWVRTLRRDSSMWRMNAPCFRLPIPTVSGK